MIIDGHAHAYGNYLTPYSISEYLSRNRIDMLVLTPGELNSKRTYHLADKASIKPYKDIVSLNKKLTRIIIAITRMKYQIAKVNQYMFKLKKQLPKKVIQSYWLTQVQTKQLDIDYATMRFSMLKIHQCWDYFKIDGKWFSDVCGWCQYHDIPLFIHLYSHKDVIKLIAIIKKNPNLRIIIAHLYGMEIFAEESADSFKNVWFDISNAFFVSKERIQLTISHFGANRLLLGSDTPYGVNALEYTIRYINSLPLSSSDIKLIFVAYMRNLLYID